MRFFVGFLGVWAPFFLSRGVGGRFFGVLCEFLLGGWVRVEGVMGFVSRLECVGFVAEELVLALRSSYWI